MNKRTRYFVVGSVAIVTLGLCTGLFAFYSGGMPLTSTAQGPNELAYMPADATGVAFANVQEVMNSEFRQKLNQVVPSGEGRDEFLDKTGIDIERDIDTVCAAVSLDQKDAVVVVRGRFNNTQIESLIRTEGGAVEDYKDVRVVTAGSTSSETDGDGAHRFAVAFLEPGLLAVGPTDGVKRAIDAKVSGQNATTNSELMAFVNDIRSGQTAWAVSRFDAVKQQAEIPDQILEHLPAVQWFALSTRINGGVTGSLRADTTDEAAAENLRDVVRGGLAMGRLVSGEDPRMKLLLDSMQLSGTGKTVTVSFHVSPEIVDVLAGIAALSDGQTTIK